MSCFENFAPLLQLVIDNMTNLLDKELISGNGKALNMNKTLLLLAWCGSTLAAFGDPGYINLNDNVAINISINEGGTTVTMPTNANSYYFTVLEWTGAVAPSAINSSSDLLNANWYSTGDMGTNGHTVPLAGKVAANIFYQVPANWDAGQSSYYVIVGWSATEGSLWTTIFNSIQTGDWTDYSPNTGQLGWSMIGNATAGPYEAPVSLWGTSGNRVTQGFTLMPVVPEPSTMALAGLGGLSLLLSRRRK